MSKLWFGALVLLAAPPIARAEYVNFRDSTTFSGVDGQAFYSVNKTGGSMLLQAEPDGAVMSWTSQGGIGIHDSWEDYAPLEIGGREILSVTFSSPSTLHSATLRNLYNMGPYKQTGWYELDRSGKWVPFTAAQDQQIGTDGDLTVAINSQATEIAFAAPGWERRQVHDFTVAGLEAEIGKVPEPASILVFATVLCAAGFRRHWMRKCSNQT